MHYFEYKKGELYCEDVALKDLAENVGTPTYIYSQKTIERHFQAYQSGFQNTDHLICYSVKANSNLSILRLLGEMGAGFDIVSQGELYRVLQAGCDPKKVVFSGVGKTQTEMAYALDHNILSFNVESEQELKVLNAIAKEKNKKAPVSLRVNPDIDPKTHPYISTGLKKNKFGIPMEEAKSIFKNLAQYPNIQFMGMDCHIGSQMLSLDPILETVRELKKLILDLKTHGIEIRHLNLGGGLGISYTTETPPSPQEYLKEVLKELEDLHLKILIEPGRSIMGNAGILLTQVLYTKTNTSKNFVIVDAAMNDLIGPTLYQAHQDIWPVAGEKRSMTTVDIVGPICESGDFLGQDRDLPELKSKDLLAIMGAGAYGFTMSSNYNSRPRVAEVLVLGETYKVIRKRETLEDLIRGESL